MLNKWILIILLLASPICFAKKTIHVDKSISEILHENDDVKKRIKTALMKFNISLAELKFKYVELKESIEDTINNIPSTPQSHIPESRIPE